MADIVDTANALQEMEVRLAYQSRRRSVLPALGECYFCEEPVSLRHLFCDESCSHDWERLQGANARAGKGSAGSGWAARQVPAIAPSSTAPV